MNQRDDAGTSHADFLLSGGGLASATAAETLRQEGAEGSIVIVSAENELPYHRPPLSTRFLLSDPPPDTPLVLTADFYVEHEITVLRGTREITVEPQSQVVHTAPSGPIHYGKLLLATGARPVRFSTPGSTLPGIHYLRTLDDARAIKDAAKTAKHAVVVGGSFLSMELSAALVQKGLHVTMLTRKQALFDKLEDPSICEYFREIYSRRDIEIIVDDIVAEFRGDDRLEAVVTQDGRILLCDFAAIGIGVTPNVEFLQGSGIAVEDGVLVDRYLKTNQPNIFAAGDVANFFDPVFNVRRRIEHWDNAVKQGRLAAKNILDLRLPYDEVSYFACELFDFSFQFIGMADNAHDRAQIGSLQAQSCALLYLKNDVPRAVAGVSIGAFNGAIIAANPRHAAKALSAFWNDISVHAPDFPDERTRRLFSSWQTLVFGVPAFFRPRWATPQFGAEYPISWTGFYDPSPVKELLSKYVDFSFLKSSPVRLLVSAVNVETAGLEVVDSYVDDLTPDHILASGSLPPAFPWTTINGKHYWDGGIMSNSPLELVVERCGAVGKRIFIVDLFPSKKPLPSNLIEVTGRRDEIVYTERIRRDSTEQALISDFRKLVEGILTRVQPVTAAQIRQWPPYIQLMGDDTRMDITRITREGAEGEPASKDYDFSKTSITNHMQAGYEMEKQALKSHQHRSYCHPVEPVHSV